MQTETVKRVMLPIRGSYQFGCDPEVFLRKGKKIIGSELIVPPNGLSPMNSGAYADSRPAKEGVTRDGVQAEIHIHPGSCRANFSNYVWHGLKVLRRKALEQGADIDLNQLVTISEGELSKLSDDSKVVGCAPSNSIYNDKTPDIDGSVYRKRSAGGHIHIAFTTKDVEDVNAARQRCVAMLDVFVGNSAVLLDRSRGAKERRRFYGRAGEFRAKGYGLEYRTLSNFWLHSPHLVTLLLGLCDTAMSAAIGNELVGAHRRTVLKRGATKKQMEYYKDKYLGVTPDPYDFIMERVDLQNVRRAINENDYVLALRNFRKTVHPFLVQYKPRMLPNLSAENIAHFYYLSYRIRKEGISKVFNVDEAEKWAQHWMKDAHDTGWGDWCRKMEITKGFKRFMAEKGDKLGFRFDQSYWGTWVPKQLGKD